MSDTLTSHKVLILCFPQCLTSPVSSGPHARYQGQLEGNSLSQQQFQPAVNPNRFNAVSQGQYPISHSGQAQHSGQTWPRTVPFNQQQAGRGRYPSNLHLGNEYSNLSASPQHFPPANASSFQPGRTVSDTRPQVRLPRSGPQTPQKSDTRGSSYDTSATPSRSPSMKSRSNSQQINKEFTPKSIPGSFRRHRQSNSGSSKASTGSNPWSQVTPTKTLTQPSSPDTSSQPISRDIFNPLPSLEDLRIQDNEDEEWLLLRKETLQKPRSDIQKDKYGHIHSVVRKYASQTIPELKLGEPRWADAVWSRRWEIEETLERDKKEFLEKGRKSPVQTCMTEKESKAYSLAQETLALLKELDTDSKKEK